MIWTNKIAIENNVVTVNTTLKRFRKNPPVFSKFCEDTQPICEEARKGENRLLDSELAEYLDLFSKTDLNKQLTESLEEQLSDTSSETASNPSPKPKEECVRVTKIEGHRKTDGTSTFKENDVKVSNVMGAMPEKKIFKDMLFILSFPTLNPKSDKAIYDGFDKPYLHSQIKKGAGTIVNHVESIKSSSLRRTILITTRPCRTKKFMFALGTGIRIVSFAWIKICCNNNQLIDLNGFILSNGFSDELCHYTNAKHAEGGVFRSLNFLVVGSLEFQKEWGFVLKSASGNVSNSKEFIQGKSIDYCLIEENFDPTKGKVRNVSTEFIVQCLINQRIIDWRKYSSLLSLK